MSSLASKADLFALATRLFPICRSITGNGVRETLRILKEYLPGLEVHEVPTGTPAFDWVVPDEWNIFGAQLIGPDGECIADFAHNNLHVVGYSTPVDRDLALEELQSHLHSLPEQPDAIPYVTSYYKRDWGFCITHRQREKLKPGLYHARIHSDLKPGFLTYSDLVIPGESRDEILLSTYICHPSMANNELTGPVIATFLAQWIASSPRKYTYRFAFVPETIGTLVYLSKLLPHFQSVTRAGFVITCCGDPGRFSFLPSRTGTTYADRLARSVLSINEPTFQEYDFLKRGSDERQYCSPLVDLPVASIMRSKYHEYSEYHTSLDNLDFITPEALRRTLEIYSKVISANESNCVPHATVIGEPLLSKYDLYPTTGGQVNQLNVALTLDLLGLADGKSDLVDLSLRLKCEITELRKRADLLASHGLLRLEPIKHITPDKI